MPSNRKLSDLYRRGKTVDFPVPDSDEVVSIWLQKLTPIEHEKALRKANAERSRFLALKRRNPDDDELLLVTFEIEDYDVDQLIQYLVALETSTLVAVKEDELAFEEEWSKDNYLQGLRDAWNDGLSNTYALNPEDEEAKHVFDELQRFSDAVQGLLDAEERRLRKDLEMESEEVLRQRAREKVIDAQADIRWLTEYRKSELMFAVRDPDDRNEYYFAERRELDECSHEVLTRLLSEYQSLIVEPIEGKD